MPIKVLVVDYGESAIRIAKSINELGYVPIGVYTDEEIASDRRRVFKYDVKVPSLRDYDSIIRVAERYNVDAVHPGSSSLSEDLTFAKRVIERGFIYIGPPLNVLEIAVNRATTKKRLEELGAPTAPWKIVRGVDDIREFAESYGYPIIVRSSVGGLATVITKETGVESAYSSAREEAERRGARELIVEAATDKSKYLEVQIVSDGSSVVHLHDRDLSISFNGRTVVSEAPAPTVSSEIRERYLREAVSFVKSLGFVGVCSVGLLYDLRSREYFFVDFTPRLKPEHYASEMVTGVDLVKKQIKVALDRRLELSQESVAASGHSIDVSIDACNPLKKKCSDGVVKYYSEPSGMGLRIESCIDRDVEVKSGRAAGVSRIVVWGADRYEALHRLESVLDQYVIVGVETSIPLAKSIIAHPAFRKGYYSISFIESSWNDLVAEVRSREQIHAQLLLSVLQYANRKLMERASKYRVEPSKYIDAKISSIKRKAWVYWVSIKRRAHRPKK